MKRTRKADSRDGWYELTPGDAQALLDGQPTNRPLREVKAIRFAADIDAGKWRPNGEPIILDESDRLLDGQGRCRGCVIAGKAIEVYVIHGVPRRYFATVDTGQVRTGSDTLALKGTKNYTVASSAARLAIVCEMGSPSTNANAVVPNWRIEEWMKKHGERLTKAMEDLAPVWHKSPLAPSILVYVYMEAKASDETKAYRWAMGVALGENLAKGSPMLALRNRLIGLKGEAGKVRAYDKLAWAIKSWNAFRDNEDLLLVKRVKRTSGRGAEAFPTIM